MSSPVLSARGLACGYRRVPVLKDVDLDIAAGELTVLVGPNGSGKTTLLRSLGGLLPPLTGEILIRGVPIARLGVRKRARLAAYVPQMEAAVPGFTVRETVWAGRFARLGWFAPGGPDDERAVAAALQAVGLAGDAERPASELSGGEFRRLLIARALAQEAPVLLLDEPEAHLDAGHQAEILDMLRRLARGGAAVAATIHDLNLASLWADRIGMLTGGRLSTPAAPEEALSDKAVEGAYRAGLIRVDHPGVERPQFLHRPPHGERSESAG